MSEVRDSDERSYPAFEVRGSGLGGGGGREEIPHALKPKARGGGREELPHAPTPKTGGAAERRSPVSEVRDSDERSYPAFEVRGSGRECQTATAQEWLRGATPRPRSGAVAERRYPTPLSPRPGAVGGRSNPTPPA